MKKLNTFLFLLGCLGYVSYSQNLVTIDNTVISINGVTLTVHGNFRNDQGKVVNEGELRLSGDWVNLGEYSSISGTFNLLGTAMLFTPGNWPYEHLSINTSNRVSVTENLVISGQLELISGILDLSGGVSTQIDATGIILGGNSNAYVNGRIISSQTGDFILPVGTTTEYLPVELFGVINTTSMELGASSLGITLPTSNEIIVSPNRFWEITSGGTFSATGISLPLINETFVNNQDLAIIGFAPSLSGQPGILGSSQLTGNTTSGTIRTDAAIQPGFFFIAEDITAAVLFQADSTALVDFYNNNNGASWANNTNWLQAGQNVDTWFGITLNTEANRVEALSLPNNGLSGTLTNDLNILDALTSLDLATNDLESIGTDFSGLTAASTINLDENRLDFEDLEPIASNPVVSYANQQNDGVVSISPNELTIIPVGSDQMLSGGVSGSANQYQWTLDGQNIDGATDPNYTITSIDRSNMGSYSLRATNTLVPGLTFNSVAIDVLASAVISVEVSDQTGIVLQENVNGLLYELPNQSPEPLDLPGSLDVSSTFDFPPVVLGDFLVVVESAIELDDPNARFIPTYFGDVFEYTLADTLVLNGDTTIQIVMEELPGTPSGTGSVGGIIEEDFPEDDARVNTRRRAARRKCGLKRRRSGGRTGQDDDEFELIAYGETNDQGEFEYGFLPEGTYRFFVEYPGIPLDESSFVQFEIGEAGVSDDSFVLAVFASPEGIEIELVLGITSEFFTEFSIYPNPITDLLIIEYGESKGDIDLEISSMEGRSLFKGELERNQRRVEINTSEYTSGQYFIKFVDKKHKDNVLIYRLIKK
ncbi:MAG: T9SS type A sorting domain-containing protein [Bacteroidota bacterium]